MKYKEHPIAAMFPMMADDQYQSFKQDVAEHGLKSSGLLYEGKILDGRNRYRACQELGLQMDWQEVELSDDADFDPVAYVISHNLHRRHLTTAQRSMVAAKLANIKREDNLKRGDKKPEGQNCTSVSDAAKLLQVSDRSVKNARQVVERGSKELVQAVEAGELNLNQAVNITKAVPDKSEQAKVIKEGKDAIKAAVAKPKSEAKPQKKTATVEPAAIEEQDEPDDYDYPFVKAFEQCDYRLNTMKKLVSMLTDTEREIVKEWLLAGAAS